MNPVTINDLAPGSTLAGYRIEALVARGGMGVVYRATELSLDREVALKVIAPELASDSAFRRRFLTESRLGASLGHPHILPVYAAGEAGGVLYLVTRHLDSDLKEVLAREGRLEAGRALRLLGQLADALDAAHANGLVHRDVKPANVLLDRQDNAYLADFGLTKELTDATRRSLTGQIVGTLDYLAPEQIRGDKVDGRTDEYALACLLYQCLQGEPPFRRRTEAETLWAHMQTEPPPLADHPELDAVLARGLAKMAQDRWANCSELVAAARAALAVPGGGGTDSPAPRPSPPAGTVTFLFTDIEGSTRLAKSLGERWPAAISEHQRLLREAFERFGGYEIDTQGDAFFVAFARAKDAVEASVNGQAALQSHRWPGHEPIAVRMGLHTGEAQLAAGKYRGVSVHRAARICAAAHGGQIVVSESTQRVLEDDPVPDVVLRDLGRFKLKDIDWPEYLFQAAAEGLPVEFPPLRADRPPKPLWRRPRLLVAACVMVVAAVVATVLGMSSGSPAGLASIDPNSVGQIDPSTGRIVSEVPVGTDPTRLATGADGSLWVVNYRDGTLTRIGPKASKRTGSARDGALVDDLAVGARGVWAFSRTTGSLLQIDPRFGGVANTISICKGGCGFEGGGGNGGVAVGLGSVWATDGLTRLERISPGSRRIAHVELDRGAGAVAVGRGFVWVGGAGGVTQVDPTRLGAVQTWPTTAVSRLALGEGGVWAAAGPAVVKIDPVQGVPEAAISLGNTINGLAVGAGSVWAVTSSSGTLYRIDPQRNQIVDQIHTGGVPTDVAVAGGTVWVSVR